MWLIIGIILFLIYVCARLTSGVVRSNVCLVGKTAIVTGANSGIGYQTALNLASRGCRLLMADVENMDDSKRNIIKYTNNTNILTKKLDLSSLQSVREFASDILKTEERLDILINNAGIGVSENKRTKDGLHPVMQINYFGHFLLTHLLIGLLKKSAPSRIVFTSSALAFINDLNVNTLNIDAQSGAAFDNAKIYGNSKLAVIIASDIFGEKLKETGVTSNSVHPGLVATTIFKKSVLRNKFLLFLIEFVNRTYAKDPWRGSQTLVYAAVSKKMEKVTGRYLTDCRHFPKPRSAYNLEFCRDIWEASEKFVCLDDSERL